MEIETVDIVKQGFVKYSNDLFFHYLLINNEKIRNMLCQQLHEEKEIYNQIIRNNIFQYIEIKFHKDMSNWLNTLNEQQLYIVQDHLYTVNSIDELVKMI